MGMDFKLVTHYLDQIEVTDDLLEIGTDRNEGSTSVLSKIAREHNKTLYSVDIDKDLISRNIEKYQSNSIKFFNLPGEDFLNQYPNLKFSLVLLDNFDWCWESINGPISTSTKKQQESYLEKYGVEMTNHNSQMAHLKQAIGLTNMLADQCIVVCDDTFINRNYTYDGKCGAAVPYLITLGFEPNIENSGVVLVRS